MMHKFWRQMGLLYCFSKIKRQDGLYKKLWYWIYWGTDIFIKLYRTLFPNNICIQSAMFLGILSATPWQAMGPRPTVNMIECGEQLQRREHLASQLVSYLPQRCDDEHANRWHGPTHVTPRRPCTVSCVLKLLSVHFAVHCSCVI